jgi:type III secretion protein N (ATPase)
VQRLIRVEGSVREVTGEAIRIRAPHVGQGQLVWLEPLRGQRLEGRVVSVHGCDAWVLPYATTEGLHAGARVVVHDQPPGVVCSDQLLGRVLDGRGRPMDGGPAVRGTRRAIDRPPPPPLARRPVQQPFWCGVRAVDGLLTWGEGQRIGLFAGAGLGKTRLLLQLARQARPDVVVCGLVGERSREAREFVAQLAPERKARTVVVIATADTPAVLRRDAAGVATTVAEWFCEKGARVLLMLDSLTRVARAQRELGLARGEAPTRQGYPPSVFAELPRLVERAGPGARGSITAVYTVLVAGDDLEDPVADEVRGLLDGHVLLDRALAERGHYPAIDVVGSVSRVMDALVSAGQLRAARRVRTLWAAVRQSEELIRLGAYSAGADPELDEAVAKRDALAGFLRQNDDEPAPSPEALRAALEQLAC